MICFLNLKVDSIKNLRFIYLHNLKIKFKFLSLIFWIFICPKNFVKNVNLDGLDIYKNLS